LAIFLAALEDADYQANVTLSKALEWLWNVAVGPVLDELGFIDTPQAHEAWPHVWWIPVGPLSLFPIHAAGYHSVRSRSTVDRVISSFIPTVKALEHARAQLIRGGQPNPRPQIALLTSMPTTPKEDELPYAEDEVKTISSLLPSSLKRTVLWHPTKSQVMETIGVSSIAHFACHGVVDGDPSKSRMLFLDWETNPFSVADVSQLKHFNADFAYISACHAANSRSYGLLDESIHMAAAFQLAGFPTVVGTLWQINDQHSAGVAEYVYRAMLANSETLNVRNAASGLHFAIRKLRDMKRGKTKTLDTLTWAPYVHVGV